MIPACSFIHKFGPCGGDQVVVILVFILLLIFVLFSPLPFPSAIRCTVYERNTVRPRSPVKSSSVYIICVLLEKEVLEFSGTAFAVNAKRVITAFHNICEKRKAASAASSPTDTHIYYTCVLVKSLHKQPETIAYPKEQIRVQLIAHDVSDDWAVFERMDGRAFEDFIPVCPVDELPQPSTDTSLTAYYAPLSFVNDEIDAIKRLKVWSEPTSLLQYDDGESIVDQCAIVVSGKVQGASGSPIVTADGKALAFHTDSFNEQTRKSREVDVDAGGEGMAGKAKVAKLTTEALRAHLQSEVSGLKAEIDSTRSHADYSRAIVISMTPELMNALVY